MHSGDQNNANLKAAQDAVHHCCMAGISEIFEVKDRRTQTKVHADIYVPHPEQADSSVVTNYLDGWSAEAEVHRGGANPRGIAFDGDPETQITTAIVTPVGIGGFRGTELNPDAAQLYLMLGESGYNLIRNAPYAF